jgi:hypothetical protein
VPLPCGVACKGPAAAAAAVLETGDATRVRLLADTGLCLHLVGSASASAAAAMEGAAGDITEAADGQAGAL